MRRRRGRTRASAPPGLSGDGPLPPLSECVRRSIENYFRELNGHEAGEVYELVLSEIEPPLLRVVLRETRCNLTRAAGMLGLTRATLRKKLRKYRLNKKELRE
ncbi:MAG TPA: helix-turn-helix domain-containing protein [Gammaproteobacteria bacterium]|nr:helix-turn-helix domain-containing protein [Gammaproteobacteria bacterium]